MNHEDIQGNMTDLGDLQVHNVGNLFEAINSEEVCKI
jgi:hypothetical protein